MRAKKIPSNGSAEKTIKATRRATRRRYTADEKIQIVLQGLREKESIAELCRRPRSVRSRSASLVLCLDDYVVAFQPIGGCGNFN